VSGSCDGTVTKCANGDAAITLSRKGAARDSIARMQRSAGVSAVAIVVLIGSILVNALGLLTAGFALVMPQLPPRPGRPPMTAGFLLAGSLVYLLPGIWGVVSGIGLWRLRNWARISTIVFAVVAGLGGLMALGLAFVFSAMPVPSSDGLSPEDAARAMAVVRAIALIISAVLAGIAVWWTVLLTRPTVIQQFTGTADDQVTLNSRRPLSITVVAVLMLIGAPFAVVGMLLRQPVPLFTTVLTGTASVIYAIAIAAALTYCGLGLLRLKPTARTVAIGYFVFGILSTTVFFLAPGRDARLTDLMARQHAVFPTSPPRTSPVLPTNILMMFGLGGGLVFAALPLYFLVTRRAAFAPVETDPIWPDAPPG